MDPTHLNSDPVQKTDPVCGMVVKHNSPHKHVWESHEYWFCSAGCRAKFLYNPKQYVVLPRSSPMPAKLTSANAKSSSGKYTCPMHPEIVKDGPGNCPICGMALSPLPELQKSLAPSMQMRRILPHVAHDFLHGGENGLMNHGHPRLQILMHHDVSRC